jgi:hypothetical protein
LNPVALVAVLGVGSSFGVVHAPFIDDPLERTHLFNLYIFVFIKYKIVNGTTQTAEIERKFGSTTCFFLFKTVRSCTAPFASRASQSSRCKTFYS